MTADNLTTMETVLNLLQGLAKEGEGFVWRICATVPASWETRAMGGNCDCIIPYFDTDTSWLMLAASKERTHGAFRCIVQLPRNWKTMDFKQSMRFIVKHGRGYVIDPDSAHKIEFLKDAIAGDRGAWHVSKE